MTCGTVQCLSLAGEWRSATISQQDTDDIDPAGGGRLPQRLAGTSRWIDAIILEEAFHDVHEVASACQHERLVAVRPRVGTWARQPRVQDVDTRQLPKDLRQANEFGGSIRVSEACNDRARVPTSHECSNQDRECPLVRDGTAFPNDAGSDAQSERRHARPTRPESARLRQALPNGHRRDASRRPRHAREALQVVVIRER